MDNEKLENIEITIAHQDQQIQDLNDVITDQWKQIERLNLRLDKVLGKIERLEDSQNGDDAIIVDKPPHY